MGDRGVGGSGKGLVDRERRERSRGKGGVGGRGRRVLVEEGVGEKRRSIKQNLIITLIEKKEKKRNRTEREGARLSPPKKKTFGGKWQESSRCFNTPFDHTASDSIPF